MTLDTTAGRVTIGHRDPRRGTIADVSFTKTLAPGTDYTIQVVLKGVSVSVVVNGSFVGSYGFNGVLVDGAFGLLSRAGKTSFDMVRIRTNDPAFTVSASGAPSTTLGTTHTISSSTSSGSSTTISSSTSGAIAAPKETTISSGPPDRSSSG